MATMMASSAGGKSRFPATAREIIDVKIASRPTSPPALHLTSGQANGQRRFVIADPWLLMQQQDQTEALHVLNGSGATSKPRRYL
jgi:hypothetical protein